MKIAVIADIHANALALQTFLNDIADEDVKYILNAGDTLFVGPNVKETLKMISSDPRFKNILGNNDLACLGHPHLTKFSQQSIDYIKKTMTERDMDLLDSFSESLRLEIDGKSIYMTHSVPNDTLTMPPMYQKMTLSDGFAVYPDADIIIHGHVHAQMLLTDPNSNRLILCPGAIGVTKVNTIEYAMLYFNDGNCNIEFRKITYDVNQIKDQIKREQRETELRLSFFK